MTIVPILLFALLSWQKGYSYICSPGARMGIPIYVIFEGMLIALLINKKMTFFDS